MLGTRFTSSRGVLSPSKALKLFNLYMEDTQRMNDDPDILTELCLDANFALSRIQRSERRDLVSSGSLEDMVLYQSIASAHFEIARLFERLGRSSDAQKSDRKAEKWGYVQGSNITCQELSCNSNTNTNQECSGTSINRPKEIIKAERTNTTYSVAIIPREIFRHDVARVIFKYNLPRPDTHLIDIHQLVYCLSLLSFAHQPLNDLTAQEQEWCLARLDDQDEQDRLHNLVSDVITLFIHDDIKSEATVAEVVALAPVLDYDQYRTILMTLVNGIGQNIMLETHLLEGLVQLMQHASPKYLDSDDLVNILSALSSRLQGTHEQSSGHVYRLCVAVSHVLDAMVNNQVKGLKREQLHEPLAAYLEGLKDSSDPHLVYHAAYAFQALLYIPDDETPMQAMLRRTSAVVRGIFGVVSAVKDWDLNTFVDELSDIQEQLPSAADIVDVGSDLYENAIPLYESGAAFKQIMEEALGFSRKTAWYPALRGADAFLQTGELTKFKILVCEAPCRQELAFQWGLCQRLGRVAANTQWTMETRQDAVAFLGEMYKNDKDWRHHVEIKQCIVSILKGLASLSTDGLQAANSLLRDLAIDGDANKQQLYKDCSDEPVSQYPFIGAQTPPLSSSLLDRVQNKPDVEKSLRLLKRQRMETRDDKYFYIQQYAKANPQASNDKLFLLMDKVKQFLDSDQKVMLVQGDSGVGKSTFNRTLECTLWEAYRKNHGQIPLFINLPSIDNPTKDMVAKQLRMHDFTEEQIKELKMARSFILICDGYDETMQTNNLYVTNRLNQPGEWMCQMVVSCRSEYLGTDYRDRFQPMDRNRQAEVGLFQEAVIVPFSEAQIDDYIEQYVATMDLLWGVEDYRRALKMVPSLQELVRNPFLLSMSLEVLPRMVDPHQNISRKQIKRITLYDQFVELWFERGKKRLGEISASDKRMFRTLCDEGFAQNGVRYLTDLAVEIYKHQDGNPVVEYSPSKHKDTWKEKYFSRESRKDLLREASPLSRTGNQYRFVHHSILEYCVVRAIFEPQEVTNALAISREVAATQTCRRHSVGSIYSFEAEETKMVEQEVNLVKVDENSPLVWRSFVNEPSILEFLKDRVRMEVEFKRQLYEYVELSRSDKKWRTAAANAMTILVRAGESFIEADLRDIQIPGADLSHGVFDCAQLQRADLRNVNLSRCWLQEADLSGAKMAGVRFGEWALLREGGYVFRGSYSTDGKTFVAAINKRQSSDGYISIYDTLTWEKRMTLEINVRNYSFIYSPDSRHIAVWYGKGAIHVLDTTSGALIQTLKGHTDIVNYAVYSPDGGRLASASKNGSVHVWDTRTGVVQYILEGHTGEVTNVVYSSDGKQIATGGVDETVRLWDTSSGKLVLMLRDSGSQVRQIVYSPNSQEIITRDYYGYSLDVWDASSGQKKWALEHSFPPNDVQYSPDGKHAASFSWKTAFQWNMQTGEMIHTLLDHFYSIIDLKYLPNGEQIVICAWDNTVRLWDARSGQLTNTLYGHSSIIYGVACSPNSHQIASFSKDGTIRLWDAHSRQSSHHSYGHTKLISLVRFSPDGQHIASCSHDNTVRVWDSRTGQCIHVLQCRSNDVKYTPDGRLLAFCTLNGDQHLYLWDAESGQVVYALDSPNQDGDIVTSDISPIGHLIACGHQSGNVSVWNTQTGLLVRTLQGHDSRVEGVLFSPSGHQIASYDEANRIRIWTAHSEDLLHELEGVGYSTSYLVYTPNSLKLAFIQDSMKLQLWSAETGQFCHETKFYKPQRKISFSPSSQLMVVGSAKGAISMVDLESGNILHVLEGHTGRITAISYSCDGQYVASSSVDTTVRLWDPESAQCLAIIPYVGGYVEALVWNVSEEGCFLVTGHDDGSIRMWQIAKSEDGQCHTRLKWSTKQSILNASEASIRDVAGLSEANRKLLKQYGAVDDPTECPTSPEVSHDINTTMPMPLEAKELGGDVSNTNSKKDGSRARLLIAKSEVTKGYRFICSKCSECDECEVAHFILSGTYDSIDNNDQHHKEENMHVDLME
ncbi:hypothetical protein BX616_004801 [Lobosporangium transversale]|nr:hypothetical protein BX616_004801 [Lobosporangium transversale]